MFAETRDRTATPRAHSVPGKVFFFFHRAQDRARQGSATAAESDDEGDGDDDEAVA
jgi:hypothetical protein